MVVCLEMKIIEAIPEDGYRIFLRFEDGVQGVIDLGEYAGKGVFSAWLEPGVFAQVIINEAGGLEWPGDLDFCPDALYLKMTGKRSEDLFPALRRIPTHA